ncbi:MAG: abortive infection family protein [Phycisphaerae bacterium]|nr:abortive infection family protein [Phycisphaerae bacterium]
MAGMSRMDIKKLVNRYIGVSGGYLGDFTYRTHADFYVEYCGLEIDPYQFSGTTRERFERILETSPPQVQAKIIRGIIEKYPPNGGDADKSQLAEGFIALAERLEKTATIDFTAPVFTCEIVERAINDAETLIRTCGPASGVDRVHTALHGYLRKACDDATVPYEPGATITALFKKLRADHPALKVDGPRAQDITQVMRAISSIMDALNPLRNNASVAHPNEVLLDEPEAMLAINAARTILHYLDAKLAKHRKDKEIRVRKAQTVTAPCDDDIPF